MNNPFDYVPDPRCDEAFGRLLLHIGKLKRSARAADISFCRELEAGKMLGVLIAADASGAYHRLYAFSGQIGADGFHRPGFVGPVFDYLAPDGYFKTREAIISRLSRRRVNSAPACAGAGCLNFGREGGRRYLLSSSGAISL